jgi:hypothetical protein
MKWTTSDARDQQIASGSCANGQQAEQDKHDCGDVKLRCVAGTLGQKNREQNDHRSKA